MDIGCGMHGEESGGTSNVMGQGASDVGKEDGPATTATTTR